MAFKKRSKEESNVTGEGGPAAIAKEKRSIRPAKKRGSKAKTNTSGKRFILIIGDEGAILVFMHGAKVVRRLFAPSPQPSHTEAIVELMQVNPKVPLFILADVLDQQYVPQSFPPVSSLSVGGLVKRRLDRDFQAEDLKGSLPLGRDKTGRKEWHFLLIAVAKTPLLTQWLDLLVELPNEMKGIYLVPVEAVHYINALSKAISESKPRPWQLLISHNKVSGFRQVVAQDGRLVFTRVSQAIDDAIPAVIAGNIEQEITNTIEYLKRLSFQDSSDLEAIVIVSGDVIESLDLNRFGFAQAHALTPMDVADALKLEQAALSADRFGDVVMAAGFGIAKKRQLGFSTAYVDKLKKLYKARQAMRAATALIVVALIGMSLMALVSMVSDSSAISKAKAAREGLQAELDRQRKAVANLNKDLSFKSAVVATYDAYVKDAPVPSEFAKRLVPFVKPEHRIIAMSWDRPPPAAAGAAASAPPLAINVDVDFIGGAYDSTDQVSRLADSLVADIKKAMPEYDVTAGDYPWLKDSTSTATVSLDAAIPSGISIKGKSILTLTFKGPKKGVTAPPAAPTPIPGQP
jgi:hypothetical protein